MRAFLETPAIVREDSAEHSPAYGALAALRGVIEREHYDTVYKLHAYELAPRWLQTSLRGTLAHAPAATQDLLRLFALQESLEQVRVERVLGAELTAALVVDGILIAGPHDGFLAARYRLEVIAGTLLFVDAREGMRNGVYYGEDSQFLRSVLEPCRGETCLDLCTGSGVQALGMAPLAARVDAVDLNPAAVRLARMNAALNGYSDSVTVYHGDLWGPLPATATYDHIACNPPLMPVPEEVDYPLCGHGGRDGLAVVARILESLEVRLSERGRLTLIGACTGTAERASVADLVRKVLGDRLRSDLYVLLRVRLGDWVRMVSTTVQALYPGTSPGNIILRARSRYGAAFDETFVYTYLLKCGRNSGPAGLRIVDYSLVGQRSYWFVNRGRVSC